MPSLGEHNPSRAYWRSLDELADAPEFRRFVEQAFPSMLPEMASPTTRRRFLKRMGASFALAGLAGCRWPAETIVPHADRAENRTPGEPERYATAMEIGGVAQGLLVTSYDGRPIKVEGNPLHPFNRGATDAIAQASVLELYDPDRSRHVVCRSGETSRTVAWDAFDAEAAALFAAEREGDGLGLYVLCEASSSPSLARLKPMFLKRLPRARWYDYEPIDRDNERRGTKLAFGRPLRPLLHLDKADVVVCLDEDLLLTHPAALGYTRDFTARRTGDDGRMNRLYVAEGGYSITGAMADERLAISPLRVPDLLRRLERAWAGEPLDGAGADARADGFVTRVAADLKQHPGRSVLVAGANQPPEVHALVCSLNGELGSVGETVTYRADPDPDRPTHVESILALAAEMRAGRVETLLILGGNPAYDAPADVDFAARLAEVEMSLHLSPYDNETSRRCTWHVPRAHDLESWGDARAYDGTVCTIQPLIAPLYGGWSVIELLDRVMSDEPGTGYDLVRETFRSLVPAGDFERNWHQALHDGIVAETDLATLKLPLRVVDRTARASLLAEIAGAADRPAVHVIFTPDACVYDGRFANNGWLQELPAPLTKITWDNAALIDPATAKEKGIATGDVVRLTLDGRSLEIAACVMPGQATGTVVLPLGFGRSAAGSIGDGVGFNTYELRTSKAMHLAAGANLRPTGETHTLAATQDHHAIDAVGMQERAKRLPALIREATLDEYTRHPENIRHAAHHPPLESLWNEHDSPGNRWAMAIDLTRCTGCNACVMACQAENNVPIVGKEQVDNGREMHWLRVDRYFKGDPEAPQVVHQPVACHHCELAPCEQVCPVAATVHSDEGLNDMVYNRCVGTRYCSNNCPYKVRRFNYFNYRKHLEGNDVAKMVFNPEVTVRSRGVMEKCTYCVQRIASARIRAKNDEVRRRARGETVGNEDRPERRLIPDGEITPACGQVCPSRAIVFGDLSDPDSAVRRMHDHPRSYAMLAELNIKPRTKYLAKLRNPPAGE